MQIFDKLKELEIVVAALKNKLDNEQKLRIALEKRVEVISKLMEKQRNKRLNLIK